MLNDNFSIFPYFKSIYSNIHIYFNLHGYFLSLMMFLMYILTRVTATWDLGFVPYTLDSNDNYEFWDVSTPIFIFTSNHPSSFFTPSSSCPACCSSAFPPGKEWSHQPMTPCWDMWHFCRYTSHLPKLACITLSHEQLNCVGGWQCALGGRQIEKPAERAGVAVCGGRQVLPGWIGRAFEEGAAGVIAVAEG